jgi:hypothetical protein
MPTEVTERIYQQDKGYQIILTIDDQDYSNEINKIEIISSITSPWQVVIITLSIDQRDIIKKKIYGNERINLRIIVISQNLPNSSIEDINLDLTQVDDVSFAPMRQSLSEDKPQPTPFQLITVSREAFKTMTTTVNEVIYGTTIKEVLDKLVRYTKAKLVYDDISSNPIKYDCVFIPPMTLYTAMKFLDNNFGIYNGVCNLGFCSYDNIVYICNLTRKSESSNWITLTHLSTDSENQQLDSFGDGRNFYTQNPMETRYCGNKVLSNIGNNIFHIAKPKDKLFTENITTFTKICEEYGITPDQKTELFCDPILNDREVYYISTATTGDSSIKPILGRSIIDISTIVAILDRQAMVGPFLKVGEGVKLKCNASDYAELSGRYILKSSHIVLTKGYATQNQWGCGVKVNLCRTNKTSS